MPRLRENCLILCIIVTLQAHTCYGVTIDIDTSKAPQLANFATTVRKVLVEWHPMVSKSLWSPKYNSPNNFRIEFDPNYNNIGVAVAYAETRRIIASAEYFTKSQHDVGLMIHEMTHIIQSYRNCPDWLWEGIADWTRYYKYEPSRKMHSKPKSGDSYTMGYEQAAYFLQYIIDNTPQWREPYHMVYWVNKDCREGTYKDSMWKRMTGKTLEQLWTDIMESTVVVPANVPEFGCYKQYCWSWCKEPGSGNWCYTTRGRKDDKGWVKCKSEKDCNVNWQCANECHPKDYTK